MQKTENYEMNLPEQEDFFNVDHFNQNTEKTDEILKSLENPEYEETGELAELISGEGLKTAFGKMAKAVKSLISHIGAKSKPHAIQISSGEAYMKKVIGLIRVNSGDYCSGTIDFRTNNGVVNPSKIDFTMQKIYNNVSRFYCNYRQWGMLELDPVMFTYNGIVYAGFYFYRAAPRYEYIYADVKYSGMTPFLMDVYNKTTGEVVNEEIYNSLQYDCFSTNNATFNGQKNLTASDVADNLTTDTEGMVLGAAMGKKLKDDLQTLQTAINEEIKNIKNCIDVNSNAAFTDAQKANGTWTDFANTTTGAAYVPQSEWNAAYASNKKIIIGFTDGAIGIFGLKPDRLDAASITWITNEGVEFVSTAAINSGKKTLPISSNGGAYAISYGPLLEMTKEQSELKTRYKFI